MGVHIVFFKYLLGVANIIVPPSERFLMEEIPPDFYMKEVK
jgi:hypothetical protein